MAEHQHHIVTERVTDAIVEIDDDWRFTLVNERAEQIYETTEEELLGKYFWNVFSAGVDTVFEEDYRRVMETREASSFEAQYDGSDDPSGLEGWFEIDVFPENDGGLAFYFRDITDRKRREEQSAGLNDVLAEFMDTTSKQQVAEIVARAAEDRLHLPLTMIAVVDDESGELRPVAQSETAEHGIDASSLFDQDGGIGWRVFINGEREVIDSPQGELIDEQPSVEKLDIQPLSRHGVLVTGTIDPDDSFAETLAENLRTTLDRIHSDRLFQEREERLAEQNESLSRLNHINEIIRSIDQVLVSATSRREIQQAVCEELTTGDTYTFAWFGVHSNSSNRISPRNWAGEEKGYLDVVTFAAGQEPAAEPPVAEVVNTREPRVTNDVLQDPPFNRWQKAALNRGFRSNIALPILYKGSLYGVLDIYSHQQEVFNELEQNVLIELSQTIAYAINAVESKKALISDTVIDLALRLDPADHPLIAFLQEGDDREFEFKGVVPTREGDFRVFYTVSGVSNETMMEFTDQLTEVVENELVSEHEEGLQYEVIVTDESLVHWVLNRGAVPQSISSDEIGGIVQVELYGYARLRDFVEQFQSEYPNSKLIASRERERPVHTRNEFLESYENQLSERQREVLKMAYFSGYFESPRERNATDLATSMGITQPTFSTHLRAGLRNLFSLLFDKNGPD